VKTAIRSVTALLAVAANLCKVGVERVPNRNPADDLPFSLSNKKRHRHPALR